MKVFEACEYPVEFEKEEIEILTKAKSVFEGVLKEMNKRNCVALEGGYADCPDDFAIENIEFLKDWLGGFLESIPYKMY